MVFSFVRDIGNGKVCSILLLIGFIFFEIIKVPMINKPMKKVILGNYILFFLMVVMNKLNVFSFIIVNLLHRDLTLTTRTTIWKIAMEKIASDPIWGNGYLSGAEFESLLPSIIGVNAHNTILMVAFIGGVALSVVFLMVLFHSTNLYDRLPNIQKLWFLPVVLLAMFLRSQVEGGDAVYLIATATLIASIVKYCPISEQE